MVGGANGIGAATAERLIEEGAIALIADIDAKGMQATVARLNAIRADSAFGRVCDLADAASIEAMIAGFAEQFDGLDGLANIAADIPASQIEKRETILDMDPALWERTFRINTIGYALTMKAALPHLRKRGGAIVNISSTAGHAAVPFVPAYSASKGGVHALTRHVAINFAKDKVRCNCVAPGWIGTASNATLADPAAQKRVAEGIPLGRLGAPEDIAAAIAFLLSDDSSWMTGQLLGVNGGVQFLA